MRSEKVFIPVRNDSVSSVIYNPDKQQNKTGIIIAHGAGNDMNNPLIIHIAEGLADAGHLTVRFNFPYKEKGRKAPDSQNVLVQTWQSVFRFIQERFNLEKIIASGKSMGGRVASQMTADGTLQADGLIFFGYPLHPPNKKDKLRDAHLYHIKVPMLFFAGTRDSLCDLELLQGVLKNINAPVSLEVIEGGDHSFNTPKSLKLNRQDIYNQILEKTAVWLES